MENDYLDVSILGVKYRLKKTDDEEYLKSVADKVESKMKEISEKYPVISTDRVAVLAAMQICDEWFREIREKDAEDERLILRLEELAGSLKAVLGR